MTTTQFEPQTYWETRLKRRFDLTGVGFHRRSTAFNKWVYRVRSETLDSIFHEYGWTVEGSAVLDVGCGTGYFMEYWSQRSARPVVGIDFTEVSIKNLKAKYPEAKFYCADISDPELNLDGVYDYISIVDVLYHIVEDNRFTQVVKNLSGFCRQGTKVFVTDHFGPKTVSVVKHCRNRSLELYRTIFSNQGFKLLEIKPLFYLLMPPVGLANSILRWLGIFAWEVITGIARWEVFGNLLGRILFAFDSALRKTVRWSPSGQLAVFEFQGTPVA